MPIFSHLQNLSNCLTTRGSEKCECPKTVHGQFHITAENWELLDGSILKEFNFWEEKIITSGEKSVKMIFFKKCKSINFSV